MAAYAQNYLRQTLHFLPGAIPPTPSFLQQTPLVMVEAARLGNLLS